VELPRRCYRQKPPKCCVTRRSNRSTIVPTTGTDHDLSLSNDARERRAFGCTTDRMTARRAFVPYQPQSRDRPRLRSALTLAPSGCRRLKADGGSHHRLRIGKSNRVPFGHLLGTHAKHDRRRASTPPDRAKRARRGRPDSEKRGALSGNPQTVDLKPTKLLRKLRDSSSASAARTRKSHIIQLNIQVRPAT